jgi:hypothetical protein
VIAKIEIVEALEDPSRVALALRASAAGREFVLRAFLFEPPKGPLHARFSNEYSGPIPDVEFAVGTKGLVVIMTQGAHLIADVCFRTGTAPTARDGAAPAGDRATADAAGLEDGAPGGAGQVRWSGLGAGRYDLMIQPAQARDAEGGARGHRGPGERTVPRIRGSRRSIFGRSCGTSAIDGWVSGNGSGWGTGRGTGAREEGWRRGRESGAELGRDRGSDGSRTEVGRDRTGLGLGP